MPSKTGEPTIIFRHSLRCAVEMTQDARGKDERHPAKNLNSKLLLGKTSLQSQRAVISGTGSVAVLDFGGQQRQFVAEEIEKGADGRHKAAP